MNDTIEVKPKYQLYESGIEQEEDEENLTDPFDPEKISIDTKKVPMETFLRRIMQGTILLNPDFQRKEVWTLDKKSQMIESLMLNIPLPMFYVSADEKGNFTVVDGLQRLSTIRDFVLGDDFIKLKSEDLKGKGFRLENLEFWHQYEQFNFDDLPTNLKNRILETEFTFTIINPGTQEEVKRNIFKRINTGGLPLSSQEIRNALYLGASTQLLKQLSGSDEFKTAVGNIKSLRMEDCELILRFVAFLVRDYSSYKKTINVDTFLSDTMLIVNAMPNFQTKDFQKLVRNGNITIEDIRVSNTEKIKDSFQTGMYRSFQLFGKHTFRKSYGDNPRSPINKSLFEIWGVLLSELSHQEFANLRNNKNGLFEDYNTLLGISEFHIAISRDSMKNYAVKYRFEEIKKLINKYK